MTDPVLDKLFLLAAEARGKAHAPYSKHPVGAAILGANGEMFSGANVENAAYPLGTCAEKGAISAMVMAGEKKISQIVVAGPGEHLCSPCGGCRQSIREFADAATKIHVIDVHGKLMKSYTMDQLLPDSFGPDNVAEVNHDLQL